MFYGITYLLWKCKQIDFLDRHKEKFAIMSWEEFPKNLTYVSNDDGEMVDFSFRWDRVRDDYFVAKRGDYEMVVERPASYGPDAKTEYIWRLILQEDPLHMSESRFNSVADAQSDVETYVRQHVKF